MAGNLNIITFIKDIYQSLKHIDVCFNSLNTDINTRLGYLEDNQKYILEKLNNLEQLINKIDENMKYNNVLDKNMENELMKKINVLNNDSITEKQKLKYEELTFSNILENNYTILDINNTLVNKTLASDVFLSDENNVNDINFKNNKINGNIDGNFDINIENKNIKETINDLLF